MFSFYFLSNSRIKTLFVISNIHIRHRNLVKIVTSCSALDFQGNNFKALIYSYMVNGSLKDWLAVAPKSASWSTEWGAIQVNRGCKHHDRCGYVCRLYIHCDLKPSNVLLDVTWFFGLSRFFHHTRHNSSSYTMQFTWIKRNKQICRS